MTSQISESECVFPVTVAIPIVDYIPRCEIKEPI